MSRKHNEAVWLKAGMAQALRDQLRRPLRACRYCGRPTRNSHPTGPGGRDPIPACPGGKCRNTRMR